MVLARFGMNVLINQVKEKAQSGDNCLFELGVLKECLEEYGDRMDKLQTMLTKHGHSTRDLPLTQKKLKEYYEHLEVLQAIIDGIGQRTA